MALFRVIKAHDGLKEGEIRSLSPSANTRYMVDNGWWEEVSGEEAEPTPVRTPRRPRATKK